MADGLRAVVFDLDGVLVDSVATTRLAFERAYAEAVGSGVAPFDACVPHLGRPMPDILRLLGLPESMYPLFVRESRLLTDDVRAYPGVVAVLDRLRGAGFALAVATGRPRQRAEHVLRAAGLAPGIDAVAGSDEVEHGKPAPDVVQLALRRLDAPPEDAVMVGDSVLDLRAGRAAGTRVAAACWGLGSREELLADKPDLVADDVESLTAVLLGAGHV
jgi:AHBA synthesis associated protein